MPVWSSQEPLCCSIYSPEVSRSSPQKIPSPWHQSLMNRWFYPQAKAEGKCNSDSAWEAPLCPNSGGEGASGALSVIQGRKSLPGGGISSFILALEPWQWAYQRSVGVGTRSRWALSRRSSPTASRAGGHNAPTTAARCSSATGAAC